MQENNKYTQHNEAAWDKQALANVQWSQPVSKEVVERAKQGEWELYVLPTPINKEWLGNLQGKRVLCLASAGGQQGSVLAAAGAIVTVLDLSTEQLNKDKFVAERDGLTIELVHGSMTDLSMFEDQTFDCIVHPISNHYIESVIPVWRECYRVLKMGGSLISSFYNPVVYIHDRDQRFAKDQVIKPKYRIPFADLKDFTADEIKNKQDKGEAFVFGHSLQDLIGGQLDQGFVIKAYEEAFQPNPRFVVDPFIPTFIATLALKI
ncbi:MULTISPECIES: class I SAM-dependent methyltransferase [Myroides]|uniref:Methyltransferase domain-containing protein n=1 Tax=Myroides albus TaxID=2562892 RepID=A0A6I3LQD6_9FLAO|nr:MULTISPECIES: methyltransferase domain-containing protein [Myroides]MTG98881.1 methyltransferase domain-containing protein [Myroides albus]MVX34921.1 methyltransferase domain-containing protein [Myroides sp. LoEW2-1]